MDKSPQVCNWQNASRDRRRKCLSVEQELSHSSTSDQNSDRSNRAGPPPTSRQVVDSSDSRVRAESSPQDENLSLCLKEFCAVVDRAIWERGGLAPLAASAASARLVSCIWLRLCRILCRFRQLFFMPSVKKTTTLACSTPHGQLMGCPLNRWWLCTGGYIFVNRCHAATLCSETQMEASQFSYFWPFGLWLRGWFHSLGVKSVFIHLFAHLPFKLGLN